MEEDNDHIEIEGPLRGKQHRELRENSLLLGRSPTCDVWLKDALVSRRHARLERSPDGFWRIWDLQSSHGTAVNGKRTEMAVLADGDRIAVGGSRLTFHTTRRPSLESSRPYDVIADDTIGVEVDEYAIAEVLPPTPQMLRSLHEAVRRVSRARSIERLQELLAEEFRRALLPKKVGIGVERENTCTWPCVFDGEGNRMDAGDLTGRVGPRLKELEGTDAIRWETVSSGTRPGPGEAVKRLALLFPVRSGDRRIAHVYVEFPRADQVPLPENVEMLALLVRDAALLWENLELQEPRGSMQEQLARARAIQIHLFPERYDIDPRLEIAAENIPSMWVSGDYYDFRKLEDGRVAFIIADVMGHGLRAALLMANLQSVFRTGIQFGWSLDDMDRYLDQIVAANTAPDGFVTGLLGMCDIDARELTLLSAGHPWPSLMFEGEQADFAGLDNRGVWGFGQERTVTPITFRLPVGNWSLVAFTDGLKKPSDAVCESYPTSSIARFQSQLGQRSADELCEAIIRDVFAFVDKASVLSDDITLLVLRGVG